MGPDAVDERLDRALVTALLRDGLACSRSQLARAFSAGEVRAGGKALKPSARVAEPMRVEVVLPRPEPLRAEPEDLPLSIVHEDDALLVVDKPPGMVVHASPGHATGSLVSAILHHLGVGRSSAPPVLPTLPGNDATRPGIVHRIDKDTSGLLVVAKTAPVLTHLARQFEAHSIERVYLGIVTGEVAWGVRRIESTHGRDPQDRRRYRPDVGTRRAVTDATVVERLGGATLLRFALHTGRTHQIRMHARHLGHPIYGDALYGRPPRDPAERARWSALGRHALHASVLGFEHPATGQRVRFESPLPPDLEALCAALRRNSGTVTP